MIIKYCVPDCPTTPNFPVRSLNLMSDDGMVFVVHSRIRDVRCSTAGYLSLSVSPLIAPSISLTSIGFVLRLPLWNWSV